MRDDRTSYWIKKYKAFEALWIHSGDPTQPHAELTSGKHSNGFFNSSLVIRHPRVMQKAIAQLIAKDVLEIPEDFQNPKTCVFGSAMGSVTLAHELARQLGTLCGFTEKVDGILRLKRFPVQEGDKIVLIEDVISTGKSTMETLFAVEAAGGVVYDKVFCLVNRSGEEKVAGLPIVSLIDHSMPMWEPRLCLLCKQGSEAVRPKDNWEKLIGR